jgi:flagellin-like protein
MTPERAERAERYCSIGGTLIAFAFVVVAGVHWGGMAAAFCFACFVMGVVAQRI